MSNWKIIAGPATGGHELTVSRARSRQFSFGLTDGSTIGFSLDGRDPMASYIQELETDLQVLWRHPETKESTILERYRVSTIGDQLTGDSFEATVAGSDYRSVLERRILWASDTKTWSNTDQSVIAWNLIDQTQSRPGGWLTIWPQTGRTTGIKRTVTYEAGDSIASRIQELAEMGDGFDWAISPAGPETLALNIWYPLRGVTRDEVLHYGGAITSLNRTFNPADFANAVRVTADSDTETKLTAVEKNSPTISADKAGRWDAQIGISNITNQTNLNSRATWELNQALTRRAGYTVTLKPGWWQGPSHLWLGDRVPLIVKAGRLDIATMVRIYTISVSISDSGEEEIQLSLEMPKTTPVQEARRINRRVRALEKRLR